MISVKEFLLEQQLDEKLITFNKKAYPKFGQIVILAGGAGSGKGFIKEKLLGIDGWNFDVDELKLLAVKTPKIIQKIKDELGTDISKLDPSIPGQEDVLRNGDNVGKLHDIIGAHLKLDDKKKTAVYTSIVSADPERKPNLIFDVTLKTLEKLQNLTRQASLIGYKKENIHIVWVINDIEVAKKQNAARPRFVPVKILVNTHRGAANTMLDIIGMGESLRKWMDGDLVFAFNKVDVDKKIFDTEFVGKKGVKSKYNKSDVGFIKDAEFFYVKRAGKSVSPLKKIDKDIRAKISKYVPKNLEW